MKYIPISGISEEAFGFCIEDPITEEYNPGYSVLLESAEYNTTITEFQKAYQALSFRKLDWFSIPFTY